MADLTNRSDRMLLTDFAQGNQQAFDVFFQRHKQALFQQARFRQAWYRPPNRQDTEDIYSLFFEKFLKQIIQNESFIESIFKHNTSALPYMLVMIKNQAIEFYRSAKERYEVPLEKNNSETGKAEYEIIDNHTEERSKSIEFYNDVLRMIWEEHNLLLKEEKSNILSEIEKKITHKKIKTTEKEAQLMEKVFNLFYVIQLNNTETAEIVNIDRKTLAIKKERLKELLANYFF